MASSPKEDDDSDPLLPFDKTARPSPNIVYFRLGIVQLTSYFKYSGFATEEGLEKVSGQVIDNLVGSTFKPNDIRKDLGEDLRVWHELTEFIVHVIPSIKARVFEFEESSVYETVASARLLENAGGLHRDLRRVEKVLSLMRNILCHGWKAQQRMTQSRTDVAVGELMRVVIQVTSRGYIPTDCSAEEDKKWRNVIDAMKRVLMTCLQVFNNYCIGWEYGLLSFWLLHLDTRENQLRKLTEWITEKMEDDEIFHDPLAVIDEIKALAKSAFESCTISPPDERFRIVREVATPGKRRPKEHNLDGVLMYMFFNDKKGLLTICKADDIDHTIKFMNSEELLYEGPMPKDPEFEDGDNKHLKRCYLKKFTDLSFTTHFCAKMGIVNYAFERGGYYEMADMTATDLRRQITPALCEEEILRRISAMIEREQNVSPTEKSSGGSQDQQDWTEPGRTTTHGGDEDHSRDGAVQRLKTSDQDNLHSQPNKNNTEEDYRSNSEATVDENDSYQTDDQRGLFTEIPVILGPGEIEVLPLIIAQGIGLPMPHPDEKNPEHKMPELFKEFARLRCQLLLTTTAGRDLLRELFIYMAAWDPRDNDLYYGLLEEMLASFMREDMMGYAWDSLREHPEDPVHPEQIVMIRALSAYFGSRWETANGSPKNRRAAIRQKEEPYPTENEKLTVNVFIAQFRREVVPQVCSLIGLQGEIRRGNALPEDLPYTFWEMERIHESLLSYLRLLLVVIQSPVFKVELTKWNMAWDLITILSYLQESIPRTMTKRQEEVTPNEKSTEIEKQVSPNSPAGRSSKLPVAVERPYEVNESTASGQPTSMIGTASTGENTNNILSTSFTNDKSDPTTFSWRSVKTLLIDLLSVLALSNPSIQSYLLGKDSSSKDTDKIAAGLHAIVGCCFDDDFNNQLPARAFQALKSTIGASKSADVYEMFKSPDMRAALLTMGMAIEGDSETAETAEQSTLDEEKEIVMGSKGQSQSMTETKRLPESDKVNLAQGRDQEAPPMELSNSSGSGKKKKTRSKRKK